MEHEIGIKVYQWNTKSKKIVAQGAVRAIDQSNGTYNIYDTITDTVITLTSQSLYEIGNGPYERSR